MGVSTPTSRPTELSSKVGPVGADIEGPAQKARSRWSTGFYCRSMRMEKSIHGGASHSARRHQSECFAKATSLRGSRRWKASGLVEVVSLRGAAMKARPRP